jgi:spore coat protein A
MQKIHRDLPETTVYAYGTSAATASAKGPTLLAKVGIASQIRWENHIEDVEHFLPVDNSLHWAKPRQGGVAMVTHLHGAETLSVYDGHPDAWWTMAGDVGMSYTTDNYTYPNNQPPALIWYHDHTVGITRLNVLSGLHAMYLIQGDNEPQGFQMGSLRSCCCSKMCNLRRMEASISPTREFL